jgi:hypothetical protein
VRVFVVVCFSVPLASAMRSFALPFAGIRVCARAGRRNRGCRRKGKNTKTKSRCKQKQAAVANKSKCRPAQGHRPRREALMRMPAASHKNRKQKPSQTRTAFAYPRHKGKKPNSVARH